MKKLTDEQLRAIESTDQSIAVVAAAGSGKTTVLIDRCLRIIDGDPARLDNILAITFTEKAAAELKARLRAHLPPRSHHRLASAWIGTFHACCARMLRQHAPLVGLDPSFTIIDENAAHLIVRQTVHGTLLSSLDERDEAGVILVDALDFRNASRMLEDLMAFRWHAARVLANPNSENAKEAQLLAATKEIFHRCERAYHDALAGQDAVDFQELEIRALHLLESNADVLGSYQKRFRHLLVDEFQDTNDAQTELALTLYAPSINRLCIVGDPRQSIYRFRGANVDCFQQALDSIRRTDGEVIPLTHNFRSRAGIIDFVNRASTAMDLFSPSAEHMKAARVDDARVAGTPAVIALDVGPEEKLSSVQRRRREARAIASFIEEQVQGGARRYHDIVCLFQAMTAVEEYEAAFKASDIPYRFFGGRGLLDRQEVCDLMHALRYANNPRDGVALLGLLRSPLIGISDEECVRLGGPDGTMLAENTREHPSCTLLGELEGIAPHLKPGEILQEVIDRTGFDHVANELDPSGGMRANIDRLMSMARSLEAQAPTTLADFISFIAGLRERNARLGDPPAAGDASEAVRCMTVHTAKGLEFPVVILPDLFRREPSSSGPWIFHRNDGCAFKMKDPLHPFGQRIPSDRYERIADRERTQADAERDRLLYVAMTRAADTLVLPLHRGEKIRGRWHELLQPLASEGALSMPCTHAHVAPCSDAEEGARTDIRTFNREDMLKRGRGRARVFSVSQLEAFDRCPQEFYLKYVLALPAATLLDREATAIAANVRGTIVHGVLETLTPLNANRLDDLIREECLKLDVFPDDEAMSAIIRPIENFMSLPLFAEAADGERETRFDWSIGHHAVTGCIDWYRATDSGLEIIDFKTDAVDEAGASLREQEYDLQMMAYALALEEATGKTVARTTLAFLTPNSVKSRPIDTERRDEAALRIRAIIERIESDKYGLADATPPCYKCPYHHNGMCWEDKLADHG